LIDCGIRTYRYSAIATECNARMKALPSDTSDITTSATWSTKVSLGFSVGSRIHVGSVTGTRLSPTLRRTWTGMVLMLLVSSRWQAQMATSLRAVSWVTLMPAALLPRLQSSKPVPKTC
jgi:hypothetical protein